MTEQISEELNDDLSPEELFEQAINKEPSDELQEEEGEVQEEILFDHDPTSEDDDEYWKGFAESKGWKDDPTSVKPGYWTDYRAFVNKYDTIQESKSAKAASADLERKIDKLAKSQLEVAAKVTAQHQREMNDLKAKLEVKKQDAFSDGDQEAYNKAEEQLAKLEEPEKTDETKEEPQGELEVYANFRTANPEILSGSETFDQDLNDLLELRVNQAVTAGKIADEEQLTEFMATTLASIKSTSVKYQPKQAPKPPSTATTNNTSKPVKMDVGSLSEAQRQYYDHFMENGMPSEAKEFLEHAIKGQS